MEKRDAIRVPFHARAVIGHDSQDIEGEVTSLSTSGLFMQTGGSLAPGIAVQINLFLYGPSSHLTLNLRGTVSRCESGGIAISFIDVDGDSFIHLRNVMAAGAFDEEKIVRDFESSPIDKTVHD